MKIIADSGSTKTHWRIVHNNGSIQQENTVGFNPFYISHENMIEEMKNSFLSKIEKNSAVYFYGSGCSTPHSIKLVHDSIKTVLTNSDILVSDDMTGAARATCHKEKGIVGILGTGSNSCHYDGENIDYKIESLGYILGDEGGGSHMGKILLGDFIRKEMPSEIYSSFSKTYKLDKKTVLENVYQRERANRYMAGFAPFLLRNKTHDYISSLILKCFDEFFESNICKYPDYEKVQVHFVGSIAFYFNELLRKSAGKFGIRISKIVESPIAGLVLYHNEK